MKRSLPLVLILAACADTPPTPDQQPAPMKELVVASPPEYTAATPYSEPDGYVKQSDPVRIKPAPEPTSVPDLSFVPGPKPEPTPNTYNRYVPEAQPKVRWQNERIGPPTIEEQFNRQEPWSDTLPTPNDESPPTPL